MPLCSYQCYMYVRWKVSLNVKYSEAWHTEIAWVLAILGYKDLAWALTQEWTHSIHVATCIISTCAYQGVGA